MFTAIAVGLRERRFLRKERSGSPHRSSRIREVPRTHLQAYCPIPVYKCSQCTAGTGVRRKTGLHNSRTRDRCTDIRIFERLLGSWPRLLHKDGQSTCTHLKANCQYSEMCNEVHLLSFPLSHLKGMQYIRCWPSRRSAWLDIANLFDADEAEVNKNVKKERGQFPAILTEQAWVN